MKKDNLEGNEHESDEEGTKPKIDLECPIETKQIDSKVLCLPISDSPAVTPSSLYRNKRYITQFSEYNHTESPINNLQISDSDFSLLARVRRHLQNGLYHAPIIRDEHSPLSTNLSIQQTTHNNQQYDITQRIKIIEKRVTFAQDLVGTIKPAPKPISVQDIPVTIQEESPEQNLMIRLDRLPFQKYHLILALSMGTYWFIDGYETQSLNLNLPFLTQYLNINQQDASQLQPIYQIGSIVGTLLFAPLSFRNSAQSILLITPMVYLLFTILSIIIPNYYLFCITRFGKGVAVGAEYSGVLVAVGEFMPSLYRGRISLLLVSTWNLGSAFACLITILVQTQQFYDQQRLGVFIIIFVCYNMMIRKSIPTSARWWLHRNNYEQAEKIVSLIETKCPLRPQPITEQKNNKKQKMEWLHDSVPVSRTSLQSMPDLTTLSSPQISILILSKYQRRLIVTIILVVSHVIFIHGILQTYSQSLTTLYQIPPSDVPLYLLPIFACSFIGTLLLARFFDTLGRKVMISGTYAFSGATLVLMAMQIDGDQKPPLIRKMLSMCLVFMMAGPASCSAHLSISELFPTRYRPFTFAFYHTLYSALTCFSPLLFHPPSQQKQHFFKTYLLSAVFMIIMSLVTLLLVSETQKMSLENAQLNEKRQ